MIARRGNSNGTHKESWIAPRALAADTYCMRSQSAGCLRDFGRKAEAKFKKEAPRVERDFQRVIAYINDVIVPEVRDNSSRALRSASEQLSKAAEKLDRKAGFGPRGR